jgi:hypothetical protein
MVLTESIYEQNVLIPGETTPLVAKQHQDVISKARSTAVRFEMSMEIQAKDIVCQFDQIPLPWHIGISSIFPEQSLVILCVTKYTL